MSVIKIKGISIKNFKGISDLEISFGDTITEITGQNASGKTTVADAFSWVLFNKTLEGNEKFLIRPLDSEGNQIHNIDIEVSLTLDIDGKESVIRKIQREKWVKKRGEATSELKGSANAYLINEVPKTEGEFKEFVSSFADPETLRLVTGISCFASMKPDDRRKLLVNLSGSVSDEEMLDSDPERWSVIRSDVLEVGVEDARARAKKQLTALNAQQKEFPVRIDEAKRAVQATPTVESLEAEKDDVAKDIETKKVKQAELEATFSENALLGKKLDIKSQMDRMEREAASSLQKKSGELQIIAIEARSRFDSAFSKNATAKLEIKDAEAKLAKAKADLTGAKIRYKEASERVFDSKTTVCKSCGQILPKGKVQAITEAFERCKSEDMETAKAEIKKLSAMITSLSKSLEEMGKVGEKTFEEMENARLASVETKKQYESFNVRPDMTKNAEYMRLMAELKAIDEQILLSQTADGEIQTIVKEIAALEQKKAGIESHIVDAGRINQANKDIETRIAELEEEQRKTGQTIALTERLLIGLEEFSVAKSKKLSENVNKLFKLANFELFEYQVNGGIREICEISYQGVKYGSLNSGHQIVMGLDIIRTLQEHYGIIAPVWIDNAESINDFNLPEMPGQLILLKVTDDDKLQIHTN